VQINRTLMAISRSIGAAHSRTVALRRAPIPRLWPFLFGRAPIPCRSRFDFRSRLLFLLCFGRSTLRIITSGVTREFASIIRVDLCVVPCNPRRSISRPQRKKAKAWPCPREFSKRIRTFCLKTRTAKRKPIEGSLLIALFSV